MAELKKRFSGHSALNTVVREDWIAAIKLDPDNWNARLYVTVNDEPTKIDDSNFEVPLFTQPVRNEKTLSYADPIIISVADINSQMTREMEDSGEHLLTQGDGALSIRIGFDPVPIGSMLEWEEEKNDGSVSVVTWCVHRQQAIGTQKSMVLYELINAGDVDDVLEQTPEGEELPVNEDDITEDDVSSIMNLED